MSTGQQMASMAMLQSGNMRQQDGQPVPQAQQLPVPARLSSTIGGDFGRVASNAFGGFDGLMGPPLQQNFDRTASLTTGGQGAMDFSRLQSSAGQFHGFDGAMGSYMPQNMAGGFERTSSSNANDAFQRVASMGVQQDMFKRVSSLGGDPPVPQTPMAGGMPGPQVPGGGITGMGGPAGMGQGDQAGGVNPLGQNFNGNPMQWNPGTPSGVNNAFAMQQVTPTP